jgi:predicted nucleic acid binding AN1-type Zn finger protein
MDNIHKSNQPLSEQMRLAGLEWVRLDAVARMLEEGKTTYLAQQKTLHGDISDAKAEKLVKASPQWSDYIKNMVNAKTAANKARVDLEFIKNKFWEWQSANANNRSERRM